MKFKVAHNTFETASHIYKKSPDYIIYRMMDKNEIYTVIQIGQKKNAILEKKFYFQKFNLVNVNIAKPEVDSKFKICRLIIKPDTLTTEL